MSIEHIDAAALNRALSAALGVDIIRAEGHVERLYGGTLGDVKRITGDAYSAGGATRHFDIVLKTQQRWERYGDPHSWRREFDLYTSGLDKQMGDALRWPACYLAEADADEVRLWMEYIDGASGARLTLEAMERAAEALGRLQARLYARHDTLKGIDNLSGLNFMREDYGQWNPQTEEYLFIRGDDCPIPAHLRNMLIHMDEQAGSIFERIERLPVTLCHRDIWIENIFDLRGTTILIDWDTAGWGYMGEDIASLIADDVDISMIGDYCRTLIPAYCRGAAAHMDAALLQDNCICDMILLKFGYRFVHRYMFARDEAGKQEQVDTLQAIFDIYRP